jgi:environmental stress-induced protein Ves
MKIELIKKGETSISKWSGGTTTQLYIYPSNASLSERTFDFRISSAIVEVEESEFTSFIGYDRSLMVLEGNLEIVHENQYSKVLKQFEVDNFSGDWKTTSKGKITDFNLIFKRGIKGELNYLNIKGLNPKVLSNLPSRIGYFVISGELKIQTNNSDYIVQKGELIMIENRGEIESLNLIGDCDLVELLIF